MAIRNAFEIHLISDGAMDPVAFAAVASKAAPWVTHVHLREKQRCANEVYAAALRLLQSGVEPSKLVVNDRADVALAAGAGGVQLAWHSLPVRAARNAFAGLRIGRSVHSAAEAQEAERDGADYVLYGHVFPSRSKPGLPERGLSGLKEVAKAVAIPVIAIGGIAPEHVPLIRGAGASGIAVISGIVHAPDPAGAARRYRAAASD